MTLPPFEPLPDDPPELIPAEPMPTQPTRIRRRRSRRLIMPPGAGERADYCEALARQTHPGLSFYLISILSGAVIAGAILLDSPALFILAALLAPFLGPVVGLSLAAVLGSLGYFLRSLVAVAIGGALVFGVGATGGFASLQMTGLQFNQVVFHTEFSWADVVVLLLGATLTAYMLVRTRSKPLVSSVALAYELYLPLGAAGFGLAAGRPELLYGGLQLFAINLAVAVLAGILVMAFFGLRPLSAKGYTAGASLFLVVLAAALALTGIGQAILNNTELLNWLNPSPSLPPPTPSATFTPSPPPATETPRPTFTETPVPPTETPTETPTGTPTPSTTPTLTETWAVSATPVWGLVNAGEANGVIIRPEPGSLEQVTSLLNGSLLQILPEVVNRNGVLWLHVLTVDGKEGWVQAVLIATATPRPN